MKLASFLLTVLERIAARLEAYYASLSQESIYRPEIENNPARTRWNNLRRKISDGSFFILAKPLSMSGDGLSPALRGPRQNGLEVDFAQIFASAQQTLQRDPQSMATPNLELPQPRRLADMHTARAAKNTQAPSTFDIQQQGTALRRMSAFINENMSTIRRLSRLPAEYDFASMMAAYGKHAQQSPSVASHSPTKSVSSNASQGLYVRGVTGRGSTSPLPAPAPLRVRSRTPSLEKAMQAQHRRPITHLQPAPPPKDSLPPIPQLHTSPLPVASQSNTSAAMNAAMVHLNRRQPPRSNTPLPASPRASLALSSASVRRKLSGDANAPPVPIIPIVPPGLRELKLAASVNGDEMRFQQAQAGGV